jgi:hypothetical protein
MSWKLRLSLIVIAAIAAVIWVKMPSQADTNTEPLSKEDKGSFRHEKVSKYENGTLKIQPQNFAVSGAVRDMPKTDSADALVNRANFLNREEKREQAIRKTKNRETDVSASEEEDEEINELNKERIKKIVPGAGAGDGDFIDPLLKKSSNPNSYGPESPQAMPTPSLTFNGATAADNAAAGIGGNFTPPDVNGDVGPNHYVSSVNLVLKMFDKSGTVLAGPIKTNSLFSALPADDPCRLFNDGDPIVLYDSLADRWHVSQFSVPFFPGDELGLGINYQCVALSVTGDPTGAYYVWSYAYQANTLNDYPKVGIWTDGYHMTFNQFSTAAGNFLGLGLITQDRAKALVGDPSAAAIYVNIGALDPGSGGALPGDIDGLVAPPVGLPQIIGEFRANEFGDPIDGVRMYKWVPNFTNPNSSSLTILGDVALAPYDARSPPVSATSRNQIEQLGGIGLDAVADRSMHRFAYRNFGTTANPINSYAGNFTVNVSGVAPTTAANYQAGIRWFEMRRSGDSFSVFDQGTHNLTPGNGATGLNNWLSSIAQDNSGNIAIGFSQAGTTQRADIKIAGRTNNVQNSGTLNEGEALMFAAAGSQLGGGGRWGDYSAMNVDPVDNCTFWYTQEYYAVSSNSGWSTRVGKFRFPQCSDAPKGSIQGTVTNCATGAVINGASINATGGFNRVSNPSGTFSITSSPATYDVSASKFGFLPSSSQSVTVSNGQTQTANFCLAPTAVFSASGNPQIVSESCGVANNVPDPGEEVTISLPLQNNGAAATSNLTATLQTTGGVTSSSGTQNFGAVAANGGSVTRNFTFTTDPNLGCGSTVTLTFNVNDGTTNLGTVTRTYTTGVQQQTLSENFDGVTAPALPAGWTTVQLNGTAINWVTQTTMPSSPPNNAFANDAGVKSTSALVSPPVQIQTANAQLSFKNFYDTEPAFDGMVLEYSIDGTTWNDVTVGGSFVTGGYSTFIRSSGSATANSTLVGRLAWTGKSNVYDNVLVNLPASLNGQTVRFRWVMATDIDTATIGVRIDDVKIFGSRLCNVNCSTVAPCQTRSRNNFDSDNKSDISVYRPESGTWFLQNSQSGFTSAQFGLSTDKIVPADYDGDGKTDIAVYRGGTWYIQRSSAGFTSIQFGLPDDVPVPADFDGDCKADLAVWRPSNGTWYVLNATTGQYTSQQWGVSTDKPVTADYDGDGKADYAVYRPSNGTWYLLRSRDGFAGVQWGLSTDKPVVGDYDGDGKADYAVYRPSNGTWYLLRSRDGFSSAQWGEPTDLPVPSDYDGDGKTDIAVYRPSNGFWYLLKSTEGFAAVKFGDPNDRPIPNAFVP